MLHNIYGENVR